MSIEIITYFYQYLLSNGKQNYLTVFVDYLTKMTRGRTSRSSPAAIAAAEVQKNREDDLRIKNLLDEYCDVVEEKVMIPNLMFIIDSW